MWNRRVGIITNYPGCDLVSLLISTSCGDDNNPAAAKRRRLRQELIGETHPTAADAATNEIGHYLSLRVPAEFEDDPLRFWEKHQSSFPILSVVARVYLGMSATSRAYSKRVPRTNCALRIKKCAPRISSGIYFLSTS